MRAFRRFLQFRRSINFVCERFGTNFDLNTLLATTIRYRGVRCCAKGWQGLQYNHPYVCVCVYVEFTVSSYHPSQTN
jgi:hypothetical protein